MMDLPLSQKLISPLRSYICSACQRAIRTRASRPLTPSKLSKRHNSTRPNDQAHPLTGYYAEILSSSKAPAPTTVFTSASLPIKQESPERVRITFGSKLGGPIQVDEVVVAKPTIIAGILVPPKPSEPENCCMSGCVNCVWDTYREELEEWASKSAEARRAQRAQSSSSPYSSAATGGSENPRSQKVGMPTDVAQSMDDDGGGSDTNWSQVPGLAENEGEALFENIPVGIREFMRTEKMLKMQRQGVGSAGAGAGREPPAGQARI